MTGFQSVDRGANPLFRSNFAYFCYNNKGWENMKKYVILLLVSLVSFTAHAKVQTPVEIVQAEKDAGNFWKKQNSGALHYRMKDVIVTGENEVTYRYEYPTFLTNRFKRLLGKGDVNSILWQNLANAVYNSPQDRENLEGGVVYKFQWKAVSDASTEVLFDRGVTLIVQIDPNLL